jgi:glycogen(starch) synthase
MINVLMLGWEYPPLFSGGLGIATQGIVKALRTKARIKLIIPSAAALEDLQDVSVVGLNRVTAEEINLERLQFHFSIPHADLYSVPIALSPYQYINDLIARSGVDDFTLLQHEKTLAIVNRIFSETEVYGPNILQKVYVFTKIAEEIAARTKFDVIHAHDWVTYSAGVQIRASSGRPLILHVHSLETDRAGKGTRNEIYALEKSALEAADAIIAVSAYTKNQIIENYHIDPSRIVVIYNGIDPAKTKRKQHELRDKLVVFLGRLTHQKGPQFLIETAEKVSRVFPRVKFVVAGTGDQFVPLLEASSFKKLGSKFIFTGFLPKSKVNDMLSMADVYFMPSVSEPFGLSALEAAQFEVPGVISAQSGVAEVMKASLQADFWDTDKFANYIYALLTYDVLHREIAGKAKHDLAALTWDRASEKIADLYSSLIHP